MNTAYYECIIYGKTTERAIEFLEKLVPAIGMENIKDIRKNQYEMFIEDNYGNYYKTVKVSEKTLGYKYGRAYVDTRISADILQDVIVPQGVEQAEIVYFD